MSTAMRLKKNDFNTSSGTSFISFIFSDFYFHKRVVIS